MDKNSSDTDAIARTVACAEEVRIAARTLAFIPHAIRQAILWDVAERLRAQAGALVRINARDVEVAHELGLSAALIDRLVLTEERIAGIAQAMESIAAQPDPIGSVIAQWQQPNGLALRKIRVPLGVLAIIFESRPNVTLDAAALSLYSGNGALLRSGKESRYSAVALMEIFHAAMDTHAVSPAAIQLVPTQDRAAVSVLLTRHDLIDVIIPRGGKTLIQRIYDEARIPVFAHLEGLCHIYIDQAADRIAAEEIAFNGKMRRVSICGATETLLIHADRLADSAGLLVRLRDAGCALVGCARTVAQYPFVGEATEEDWRTEYLDKKLSIRVVDSVDDAIAHVNTYGSGHTDSIVTTDASAAQTFFEHANSAIVLHNASTQFADGGEFGMGAEIGIATGRLHARGPVGAFELTTVKYCVSPTDAEYVTRP